MKKFIKIVESITNDYSANQEIERILADIPAEKHRLVLDGLEIIHNNNIHDGIDLSDWVQHMRSISSDISEAEIHETIDIVTNSFPNMVDRQGNTLRWKAAIHTDDDLDMTDPMMPLAQAQIEYTSQLLDLMIAHGRFTERDIMTSFAATTGLPPEMVIGLVQHAIETNQSLIKSVGQGYYEIAPAERPKTPAENMAYWRDLASGN